MVSINSTRRIEMFYVAFHSDGAIESLIGSVEGHNGRELNALEIEVWLSQKEKQGFQIEYLKREEVSRRREASHGKMQSLPARHPLHQNGKGASNAR